MIELMVVVAIAALLMSMAIPSFRSMIQRQKITSVANDLFAAVNLTRAEAIGRGVRVDLVPAGDGTDWAKGWIVFIDDNHDLRPGPGEYVIFSHAPISQEINIQSAFTDSKVQYFSYTATGRSRTNGNSQTPQVGSWTLVLDAKVRRIKVNFLGRARVCNPETDKTTC